MVSVGIQCSALDSCNNSVEGAAVPSVAGHLKTLAVPVSAGMDLVVVELEDPSDDAGLVVLVKIDP